MRRSSRNGPAVWSLPVTWSTTRRYPRLPLLLRVTSASAQIDEAAVARKSRPRILLVGLVVLGGALLLVAAVQAIVDSPSQVKVADSVAPSIEVRAKFAGLAPGGQTTGFAVAPDGSLAVVDRARQRLLRPTPPP